MKALWTLMVGASLAAQAPPETSPILLGTRLNIPSQVYGESRELQISLPAAYDRTRTNYPVLYMTDGPAHLSHARGTVDFLARNGLMPELILVGLASPGRSRELAPGGPFGAEPSGEAKGADRFQAFLERDVIPAVESRYRTAPYRIFAGHSLGGLLALQLLVRRPGTFQAFIAASPSPGWDAQVLKERLEAYFKPGGRLPHRLFVTMGNEEDGDPRPNRFDQLAAALSGLQAPGFAWKASHLPDEEHATVPLLSFYGGLKFLFEGWRPPQDRFTQQFTGTAAEFRSHYQALSARMGYPVVPPEARINQIGYGFLGRKLIPEAVAMFRMAVEAYPASANAHDSLGDGLLAAGDRAGALRSFERALQLDPKLSQVADKVQQLRKAGPP